MGKGKKKGKGGGKKKKGGKKDKEIELTPNEAILAYKISLKEKDLEEVRYEIKTLQDKHERDKERNLRLADERAEYIRMLMIQARRMNQDETESFVDKNEVIVEMKKNWVVEKEERLNVKDLQKEVAKMDKKITAVQREIDYWISYREKGQYDHKTQIDVLLQDLEDMKQNYEAMTTYIESKLFKDKMEIETRTNAAITRQKDMASNSAIKALDNASRNEVTDNEWLKREYEIHKRELLAILSIVEGLEKENLEIMSELFECKVQDLKISKEFFITQFDADDNLEDHGILEVDLQKIFPSESKDNQSKQQKIISKYNEIMAKYSQQDRDMGIAVPDYDEISANEGTEDECAGEDEDDFVNLDSELEWNDCLNLGPLELKMLHIEGKAVKMHLPYQPTEEEEEAQQWSPDVWPVNKTMLHKIAEK